MTEEIKNKILSLKEKGYGYGAIAKDLGLTKNQVSSYLSRVIGTKYGYCLNCGKLYQMDKCKKKKYCSNKCKKSYFDKVILPSKDIPKYTCLYCGVTFYKPGKKNVKYCSLECYRNHEKHLSKIHKKEGAYKLINSDIYGCIYDERGDKK